MAIHCLNYNEIDITGFAGIRERVLIMQPQRFPRRPEHVWSGIGSLQYMAHAYFTAKGQTGMHHHENVDIISVITRGEIAHEGSLGDGSRILQNQVLVQCAGPKGFRHNEINVLDAISGMVQIWLKPSADTSQRQGHRVIDVKDETTFIYGEGSEFQSDTQVCLSQLKPEQESSIIPGSLCYVLAGELIHDGQVFERGCLLKADQKEFLISRHHATLLRFTATP